MLKDLSYFFKKIFISEKYLLKKKILRALNKPLEPELKILHLICDKNKASIDIGVFRGVYTYRLAELTTKVYGFEANPIMYALLSRSLVKLKKNVEIFNLALSDNDGTSNLKIPVRNKSLFKVNFEDYYEGGLATLEEKNNLADKKFDRFQVITKKLDNINFNDPVGFIKIDVEGHELSVLKGSLNFLKKNKPNLLIEINKDHSPDFQDTFKLLHDLKYKSYFYDDNQLIEIDDYYQNYRNDHKNFIFKYQK